MSSFAAYCLIHRTAQGVRKLYLTFQTQKVILNAQENALVKTTYSEAWAKKKQLEKDTILDRHRLCITRGTGSQTTTLNDAICHKMYKRHLHGCVTHSSPRWHCTLVILPSRQENLNSLFRAPLTKLIIIRIIYSKIKNQPISMKLKTNFEKANTIFYYPYFTKFVEIMTLQ